LDTFGAVSSGVLSHLRVLDLTDLRGALAGRMLADLGADVIRIERYGDEADRLTSPFAGDVAAPERSLPFLFRNLGKRGVVLDLDDPAGWTRFVTLCDRADILIENAVDPRLAPDAVRARHPHLVHATVADLGRTGPHSGWRLEPLPAFASSGALWASGFADRPPCWLPGFQAHDCASVVAVVGALAAVASRRRDERGQTVEVSVQEAAMASLAPWPIPLADYARRFPLLPHAYPRDADGPAVVLPVADGWVRLLAVTPRQLRALLALVTGREPEPAPARAPARGSPHDEPRTLLRAATARIAEGGADLANVAIGALARLPVHPDLLPAARGALQLFRRLAARALAKRRCDDVVADGQRLGLPIAPVHRPEEFVVAEQTRVRGFFRRTDFPHLRAAPVAPFPVRLSATPIVLARPAPEPGADTGDFSPREPAAPGASADARPPLDGLRVVSLCVGAVGPELCGTLRDLGAEVVKIESAGSPDFLRRLSVDFSSPNRSFMFNDENRGQRSVCLDLSTAAGRALALRLCGTADVVAENRQGGLVERLGLDYDAVRGVRPDVIYASSQGFGRGGPLGTAPAYGPMAAAFAGATWLWNHPDAPYPAGTSLEHPDHLAGRLLAVAVLAALEHRTRTGEGQYVELSQSEAAAFLLGHFYLQEPCTGRPVVQQGNASVDACPHGVYRAKGDDRWVAIAVADDAAWSCFCSVVGWKREARFATVAGRLAARDELDARVTAWTTSHTPEDATSALQAVGVSAFPVQGSDEHRADEHLAARRALVTLDDPEVGDVQHLANPLRLSGTPLVPAAPAPCLGADTEDVLVRWLGLAPSEVRRLVDDGTCR
jgi:crotonobetainyl-CoA:carnitine CoA-transferase CaiB-like acyl-CoA transferase